MTRVGTILAETKYLIFLIVFAGLIQGCTSDGYGRDSRLAPVFSPCIWWGPSECRCRESHKIIYVTKNTDFSKLYEYCKNR